MAPARADDRRRGAARRRRPAARHPLAPLFAALLDDLEAGRAPGYAGSRLHASLAALVVDLCRRLRATRRAAGRAHRRRLPEPPAQRSLRGRARRRPASRLTHALVPANDGGLSSGRPLWPAILIALPAERRHGSHARRTHSMCLAIPMRITAIDGEMATIELEGLKQRARLMLRAGRAGRRLRACARRLRHHRAQRGRTPTRRSSSQSRSAPVRGETPESTPGPMSELTRLNRLAGGGPRAAAGRRSGAVQPTAAAHLHGSLRHAHHGHLALRPAPASAPGMRLISGPGCPVCVTAMPDIDTLVALARLPEVTLSPLAIWCACRPRAPRWRASAPPAPTCASSTPPRCRATSPPPSPIARWSSPASASRPRRPRSPPPSSLRASAASQLQRPQPAQDHAGAAAGPARRRRDGASTASSCPAT